MTAPTCCLCGADETQGPLDPRRCYDQPAGSVRCVSVNECSLRAELRDAKAERDKAREQRDAVQAQNVDRGIALRDLRAAVLAVAVLLDQGIDRRAAARELRKAVQP